MFHTDLEQGTIESRPLSFTERDVSDSRYHVATCLHYSDNNECCSRSVSDSMSKSEERVCRICQLEVESDNQDLIELGCSCKEDLAFAHQVCAETWFQVKGDKLCEICNTVVMNVHGGNERIEDEVEVVVEEGEGGGPGGDAAVAEIRESWCHRWWIVIIAFVCWVLAFLGYFLQPNFKIFSNF